MTYSLSPDCDCDGSTIFSIREMLSLRIGLSTGRLFIVLYQTQNKSKRKSAKNWRKKMRKSLVISLSNWNDTLKSFLTCQKKLLETFVIRLKFEHNLDSCHLMTTIGCCFFASNTYSYFFLLCCLFLGTGIQVWIWHLTSTRKESFLLSRHLKQIQ